MASYETELIKKHMKKYPKSKSPLIRNIKKILKKKGTPKIRHLRTSKKGKRFYAGKKLLQEYKPQLEKNLEAFQEKMRNRNLHIPDKEIEKLKKLMLKNAKKHFLER